MTSQRKTICPLDCPDACGLIATVENGKLTKIAGDPDNKVTKGFICRKMRKYPEHVESDQRILHPLRRTGAKGSGSFERISWDEAWDILVDKLISIRNEHGGEALMPYSYAGNMGHVAQAAGMPFFNKFGASRQGRTICSATAKAGWKAHMGSCPGSDPQKAADASLVVVWGINVKVTNVHFWPMIQQCRKKGGKLLVIDPYKNITAKAADEYYPVKPGGDAALALGVLKVIIEKDKHNKSFIEQKTEGFADLRNYLHDITWPQFEKESGIQKNRIVELADLLIANLRTFVRIGIGLSRNSRGGMAVRAITCLGLALGLMENKAGAGVLLSSGAFQTDDTPLEHPSLSTKETRIINMVQLGDALTTLTPKIHGLFVYNSNPLSVAPDSSKVKEGLAREDLFTVVHEQLMTPTAKYADLLLPATTSFEHKDVYFTYGFFQFGITEPVIEKRGEAIDNFTLFQILARKMGYTEPAFQETLDERLQNYLSTVGGIPDTIDTKSLKPGEYIESINKNAATYEGEYLPFRFVSDNLAPDQSAITCLGDRIENDDPMLLAEFPLQLITPPNGDYLNSTFGERFTEDPGTLLIHPDDAAFRDIGDGAMVKVYNRRGHINRKAKVTEDTQPGLLVAEGVNWENPEKQIFGVNELTSQATADLAGGGTFHESLVEVCLMP